MVDGIGVGTDVGLGVTVGDSVGRDVGSGVGWRVGDGDGSGVGCGDGMGLGLGEGAGVGKTVIDGSGEGGGDGTDDTDGAAVGIGDTDGAVVDDKAGDGEVAKTGTCKQADTARPIIIRRRFSQDNMPRSKTLRNSKKKSRPPWLEIKYCKQTKQPRRVHGAPWSLLTSVLPKR